MVMTRAILLFIALSGCASQLPAVRQAPMSWASYPVELRVSSALSECQVASVAAAVAYLESRANVDLLRPVVVAADDPAVLGIPVGGVISVAPAMGLSRPEVLGEALRYVYSGTRELYYSNIEVVGCSPWVMSHEILHGLGLEHSSDPGSLMYEQARGGWSISERELSRIVGNSVRGG